MGRDPGDPDRRKGSAVVERSLMGATDPCAWRRRNPERSQRGLTLMELVVVLSIIAVLVALALPRYIIPRKNAYKMEAVNILQELKTMEWRSEEHTSEL